MVNNKKEVKRVARGSSVDPVIWDKFKRHSEKTGIPMSKLMDRAIEMFLEEAEKK
jgi:hypothetical protein